MKIASIGLLDNLFPEIPIEGPAFLIRRVFEKVDEAPLIVERDIQFETLSDYLDFCYKTTHENAKRRDMNSSVELLVRVVNLCLMQELERLNIDIENLPDNLIQRVETDFTITDFAPNDTHRLHYRIFTKRGLTLTLEDTTSLPGKED